jgi:hypothetical protein
MRKLAGVIVAVLGMALVWGQPADAAPVKHLEGHYAGNHTFTLFTGGCLVDAQGDAVVQFGTRQSWDFHTDYCGSISGNIFTAVGTFTLTLPGGAQLRGTSFTEVPLSQDGGPITLTITGGTKRYRNATGSCTQQNVVREISFGLQEQTGTMECDIVRKKR